MAQAYRLGRGVEQNMAQAEILMAKAAAQGHMRAIDVYGLMLFQDGRREQAMPYITASAERGNPRAQYLLGIGHFNGDLVPKDWLRAYALVSLANNAGFEPARAAIAQMDDFIPLEQRQQAQLVARQLKQQADGNLTTQLAANDLGIVPGSPDATAYAASAAQPTVRASRAEPVPRPLPRAPVPPSVAAAQTAIDEAARVTGSQSPASAGADFANPDTPRADAGREPPRRETTVPVRPIPPTAPQRAFVAAGTLEAAPASANAGPWRVQVGAFSVRGNADRLWAKLKAIPAVAGKERFDVESGRVVRLQFGGFATRSAAQSACDALKRSGQDCIVVR